MTASFSNLRSRPCTDKGAYEFAFDLWSDGVFLQTRRTEKFPVIIQVIDPCRLYFDGFETGSLRFPAVLIVGECPGHATHPEQMHDAHAQMNERGQKGMGLSQTSTTHHFFLNSNGGLIQVEVKDATDVSDRANIRMHLMHIAQALENSDYDIPMFVHDTAPRGVPEMKNLQEHIHYSFAETPNGGRAVMSSTDKEALTAIRRFLRFQIEEQKAGDPLEQSPESNQ